jgi:putative peptide zinc metalloprotease protein
MMVVVPLVRALQQLNLRPALRERRPAVIGVGALVVAGAALLVAWLPVPFRNQAEGVLWLPEQAIVRAGASGFVTQLAAADGQPVKAGQLLVRSRDPGLDAQIRLGEARVAELEASYLQAFVDDRPKAEIIARQLALEQETLANARDRASGLLVSAGSDGIFRMPQAADAPGRFHRKGELLGYVLDRVKPVVRIVVEQAEADAVTAQTQAVDLRLADDMGRVLPGRIVRVVPAAGDEAPSGALVSAGGGKLAGDPRDPQGRKTLARFFVIDVELMQPLSRPPAYGQRVHVRFDHHPQPLAAQWYAGLRRLFLSRFTL